ncbi:hypothetical protein C8J56DRAFT_1161681 [Mycena floridula]|nr:hypothetical protein C8J56DRAFT_1161681 [Mycena floridula]
MLHYHEFAAWINIGGSEATEYAVKTDLKSSIPTVTCWIASETGKKFTVHWKDSVLLSPGAGYVFVDGRAARGSLLEPATRFTTPFGTIQGFRTSVDTVRPFVFSEISLTDEDSFLNQQLNPSFGDISIEITRVEILGDENKPYYLKHIPGPEKLHERSKKALVHQIGAAPEPMISSSTTVRTKKAGFPIVKFVFKYRSLDQLMANDIVPRLKRVSEAVDDDDEEEDLSKEEALLEARLLEIRAKKTRKKVKREPLVPKQEDIKPAFLPGTIIDLT